MTFAERRWFDGAALGRCGWCCRTAWPSCWCAYCCSSLAGCISWALSEH